ncbi:MAG: hypothetical protein H6721_01160 [Sandaracinus sp.]|nr:hypothetical protein [Sandaracinus sp.]MCB9621862.1 hypothetical protein [Sandaracinus sp.]MCB9630752.1 hypothetical protein [Sandaracinus sp.]
MADRSEWARRVSAWRRSGLTAAEFCRGRDFAVSTLRWYSSQLGELDDVEETPEPAFARLELRRERSPRVVIVELESARVLVPEGADVDTLAVVFEALRRGDA